MKDLFNSQGVTNYVMVEARKFCAAQFWNSAASAHDLVTVIFTPLRYVPNVAKRSIWDQCKYVAYILTTDRRPTSHLEKFERPYLRNGSSDPLHVWFYGEFFGDGRCNGAISANDIDGQFTLPSETTSHHIIVDA